MKHIAAALLYSLIALGSLADANDRLLCIKQIAPTIWEQKEQAPTVMVCPKVDTAPTLDGKLDDACWQQAGSTNGFLKCDDNIALDLPAQVATVVRFCRDDENMYFAWKLFGDEAKQAAASVEPGKQYGYTGRGGRFVVILQQPDHDNWLRWSFHNNGGAASFSQKEGKAYDAPCRSAAAPFDDGAIVEIAIPFSSSQLRKPKQGEWWRMQFGRVDNGEWTAFPNSRGIFEQPKRFGYLLFDDLESGSNAVAPVPAKFELFGERHVYDADHEVTQFIAALKGVPLKGNQLHFTLMQGSKTIATLTTKPLTHSKVSLVADLRGLLPGEYNMHGKVWRNGKVLQSAPTGNWKFAINTAFNKPQPIPESGIPLLLHDQVDQPGAVWPVATAVPFERNVLFSFDKKGSLNLSQIGVYENGERIAATIGVGGYWEPALAGNSELLEHFNGSIKWLRVAFNAKYDGKTARRYVLKYAEPGDQSSPLNITWDADRYTITTGPARFSFDGKRFAGIDRAWRDANGDGEFTEDELRIHEGAGAYLVDDKGVKYEAANHDAKLTIEEMGLARIVVAIKGWYASETGEKLCLFQTRLTAYANLPQLRVDHRTILTYDTRHTQLRDLGFHIALPRPVWSQLSLDGDESFNANDKTEYWSASIHQDRHDHFRILKTVGDNATSTQQSIAKEGYRSAGWAVAHDKQRNSIEVILRDFWQKFPKELESSSEGITLHFWPQRGGDTFSQTEELLRSNFSNLLFAHEGPAMQLQIPQAYANCFHKMSKREFVSLRESIYPGLGSNGQGVTINNSFMIRLKTPGDTETSSTADLFQRDPQALADPVYACATGVLGPIRHRDDEKYPHVERLINHSYLFIKRYFEHVNAW